MDKTIMLTTEQKACNYETYKHISRVQELINQCIVNLLERGHKHDQSKLESPEVEGFTDASDLSKIPYPSEEYNKSLEKLKPALDHHYANNRHHPQFHKHGINDMNLLDVLEMLCDWKAASERQNNGNINKSIEVNADKFGLSPQLVEILENTVKYLGLT